MTDYVSIKNLKQRKLAFLEDTVNYYNSNNRGTKKNSCVYSSTTKSAGCAIGRHLFTDVAKKLDNFGSIYEFFYTLNFLLLPAWMRDMKADFLYEVQNLHDRYYNWNENGLTEVGKISYNTIKKNIKSGKI